MIDCILNFLFPVACIICQAQVFERRYSAVCPTCWDTLVQITPPICPQCGMPAAAIEGPCLRCRTGENIFDFARSAVFFNDAAREIIHHLKYGERVSLAVPIGAILQEVLNRERFTGDLVVPVPLHWKRRRSRGFNQAELVAKQLGLQVGNHIIRRRKNTETQTGLSRSERMKNLSSAFELSGSVDNRKIIVVDDVLTTGATMNEIAKVLKRGGAMKVEALTFARVPDSINGL